jgi:SAM-dependent methyltransferase
MVEAAKRVADELEITNAEFRVLDAERLELEDASVDGVICRFGYMLMGDPGRALRETRRVIRDGGAERGHLSPPDPDEPGLFSLKDPDRIEALLAEAGFAHAEVDEMEIGFRFDVGASQWAYVSELQGPIALAIAKLDDEERQAVRAAIEDGYAAFHEDGGYRLPGLVLNVLVS